MIRMVIQHWSYSTNSLACPQDSRFGEFASLAFLDCWQARSHLTLTKDINFILNANKNKKEIQICQPCLCHPYFIQFTQKRTILVNFWNPILLLLLYVLIRDISKPDYVILFLLYILIRGISKPDYLILFLLYILTRGISGPDYLILFLPYIY